MPKKKVVEKAQKIVKGHIDEIWDVLNEMQQNLDFIHDKVNRIMNRMGLE